MCQKGMTPSCQVLVRVRVSLQRRERVSETVQSLSSLHTPGMPPDLVDTSLGQLACLDHTDSVIRIAGAPPCTPTAASRGLCGYYPGFSAFWRLAAFGEPMTTCYTSTPWHTAIFGHVAGKTKPIIKTNFSLNDNVYVTHLIYGSEICGQFGGVE